MKHFRLWAICLTLAPLAVCLSPASAQAPPKSPSPAAPALTGTVTHISIIGLKNISLATVQAKLTLKVGDAYAVEAITRDTAALKGMGVFQTVSVESKPASPSGVDLAYTLTEYPIVQGIKFTDDTPTGLPSVPTADLIAQMKTVTGQVMNANILVSDLQGLFNLNTGYYLKRGYLADVDPSLNIDPKSGIIAISLHEYRIRSIQITGNSRVKTADILAQMHTKVGGFYDGNALEEDKSSIFEMGEFRQVDASTNAVGPGEVSVAVPVVEQPAAIGVLDEKQGKVIPFLYDALTVPFPVVQVSINGRPPLSFVVDTGTTAPLLLAPWAVKELALSPNSRTEKADNFTFSRVPIKSVILQGLSHGSDANLNIQDALMTDWSVLDLAIPHPHIAGVVGVGALVSATSRFDFATKTLTIFTAPHPPLHIPGGITLPLRSSSINVFTVHVILAPDTFADLVLDTGSGDTQVPLSTLPALHPAAPVFYSFHETVDGTLYLCPDLHLSGITLGKLQILDTEVGTLPAIIKQSLGMDILGGYRLTLDGPNGQLTLEPTPQGGRYTFGWAGLTVKQSGNGWEIDTFEKGSPAQGAGLRAGDRIITVNNVSVAGTQQLFCERLLGGLAGRRVQASVERGADRTIAFSWTAIDGSNAPPTAMNGLPMKKPHGGPWIISEVVEDSPGDKAGLLAGDKLTKIDGEATANMPVDRFDELVRKPSVLVEVERPGLAKPFSVRLTAPK